VAAGWFGERYGFFGHGRRAYQGPLALFAQLELTYADGGSEIVGTDPGWSVTTHGPITASGIYAGEHYDARRVIDRWSTAGTGLPGLVAAVRVPFDRRVLTAAQSPPVRRIRMLTAVDSFLTPAGRRVLDFGQNIAGRGRIRVTGDAGRTVTLRHAEVLEDGELALRPLRLAAATDSYTLAGHDIEEWEPDFTFHGFRYVQVDGWPAGADPADGVVAVVLS
jgi:alpha-L-rhamnosidase